MKVDGNFLPLQQRALLTQRMIGARAAQSPDEQSDRFAAGVFQELTRTSQDKTELAVINVVRSCVDRISTPGVPTQAYASAASYLANNAVASCVGGAAGAILQAIQDIPDEKSKRELLDTATPFLRKADPQAEFLFSAANSATSAAGIHHEPTRESLRMSNHLQALGVLAQF